MDSYLRIFLMLTALTFSSNVVTAKNEPTKSTTKKSDKTKASDQTFCRTLNLPGFKNGDSLENLKIKFDAKSKLQLTQYLWFIVLQKKPSKMAVPLLQYLSNSQTTDKMNAYYGLLASAIGINQPLYEEIKKWPDVTEPQTVKTNLKELCERYNSATEGKVNE